MNKESVREEYIKKRQLLTEAEWQLNSIAIAEHFFEYFAPVKIKYLHTYLPMREKKEVNTWNIIDKIFQEYPKINIVISKSKFATFEMDNFIFKPGTLLMENKYGIPEPPASLQVSNDDLDMVLVPLLAFDSRGYRVGYGKGFYDRFLQNCRPDVLKVGLSFFPPVNRIEDLNQFDIPLNYCITPESVIKF